MAIKIYYAEPDETASEFIYDKLISIGETPQLVNVTQIPFPCDDPALPKPIYDLSQLEDGFIVIGGHDSNPVACALKDSGVAIDWDILPDMGRIAGVGYGGKIGFVIYGLTQRDTAYSVWKFVEEDMPLQSFFDFPVEADFEDIVSETIPFIDYLTAPFDWVDNQIISGLSSVLPQYESEFKVAVPVATFAGSFFVPLGWIGKGGKIINFVGKTAKIAKGAEIVGESGKFVRAVKIVGKSKKGAEAVKWSEAIKGSITTIAKGIGLGTAVGIPVIGGGLIASSYFTKKQNNEEIFKDKNYYQAQVLEKCSPEYIALHGDSECKYNQQKLEEVEKIWEDYNKSKSASEEIKDIVLWVGTGILIIGGAYFLFKSGLFGEGARRVREKIEEGKRKTKPKEIKTTKTVTKKKKYKKIKTSKGRTIIIKV